MTKSKYTLKRCEVCNKEYGINYFYTHKKSKSHCKKVESKNLKQELLKDGVKDDTGDIGAIVQEIIDQLINLKDKLECIKEK